MLNLIPCTSFMCLEAPRNKPARQCRIETEELLNCGKLTSDWWSQHITKRIIALLLVNGPFGFPFARTSSPCSPSSSKEPRGCSKNCTGTCPVSCVIASCSFLCFQSWLSCHLLSPLSHTAPCQFPKPALLTASKELLFTFKGCIKSSHTTLFLPPQLSDRMEKNLKLQQNNIQSQLQYPHLLLASTGQFKFFQNLVKCMAEILGILQKVVQEKQENSWKYCACQHKQCNHAHLAYTCIDLDHVQEKQTEDIKLLQKLFLTCVFAPVPDCSA